jgi:hypothetical protein
MGPDARGSTTRGGGLSARALLAAFAFQALIVATIVLLSRRLEGPLPADPKRRFDTVGAALSAAGMFFLVFGILQADNDAALPAIFVAIGLVFLALFFLHARVDEAAGREPLLSLSLFRNRASNLGLVTQNVQWLLLMGISFVVSVFLQTVRDFSAIKTGVVFTAATVGTSSPRSPPRGSRDAGRSGR